MRVFKNKLFSKWAASEGLDDDSLFAAVAEIERGLVDADLGGQVFKKRVAIGGRGKRGGSERCWYTKQRPRFFLCTGLLKMFVPILPPLT